MNCLRPITIPNPRYTQLLTKINWLNSLVADVFHGVCPSSNTPNLLDEAYLELSLTDQEVIVPCRRCVNCLKMRSNEWAGRLSREYMSTLDRGCRVLFVTLTYSPEHYHDCMHTYRSDLAHLFDSLRSRFRRSVRHWCIGELGEKRKRFHIHCLFFDPPLELAPDSHFHRSKNGALMGSNSILKSRWGKGIVDVGFCKSVSACPYVAGYLVKGAAEGFFCPIVSSNSLGFSDFSDSELVEMRSKIRSLRPLFYSVGGSFQYSYPYSLIRKYIDPADRCAMRYVSFLRNVSRGGFFVLGGNFYFDKDSYMSAVFRCYGDSYNVVAPPPFRYDPSFRDFDYRAIPSDLLPPDPLLYKQLKLLL